MFLCSGLRLVLYSVICLFFCLCCPCVASPKKGAAIAARPEDPKQGPG